MLQHGPGTAKIGGAGSGQIVRSEQSAKSRTGPPLTAYCLLLTAHSPVHALPARRFASPSYHNRGVRSTDRHRGRPGPAHGAYLALGAGVWITESTVPGLLRPATSLFDRRSKGPLGDLVNP